MMIDPAMVGGVGNAYKLLFNGGFTNWAVSFNVHSLFATRHRGCPNRRG